MSRNRSRRAAFTLPEVLVVLAILSLLASLLFPAFETARGAARQAACLGNMRQIGQGVSLYLQDYDGHYPIAVGPFDRFIIPVWQQANPAFAAQVPNLPLISTVLLPYTSSTAIFRCPADVGFEQPDVITGQPRMDAFPTCFDKSGMSYSYRTQLSCFAMGESDIDLTAETNILQDPVGFWHGSLTPIAPRYNALFADGHVKNLSADQLHAIWRTPLNGNSGGPSH